MKDYSFTSLLKNRNWATEYAKPVTFDTADKKILLELAINSRIPLSKLSKKISLNRDTIKYRIERLIKAGAIQGFSAVINYSALGYKGYSVLLKITNMFKDFEDALEKFFIEDPEILKVHKVSGSWDIYMDIICKSENDFKEKISGLKNLCGGHLQDFEVLTIFEELDAHHIPASFFGQDIGKIPYPFGRVSQVPEIIYADKKDIQIIKILSKNARTTTVKIAESIMLSPDAIHNRIKRLSKNNVLKGYYLVFDPTSIKNNVYLVFVELKGHTEKREQEFKQALLNQPQIDDLFKIGYRYDYLFYMQAENPSEFNNTLMHIRTKFSDIIKDLIVLSELKEYKYTEFPSQ
ncbi:MAG: Lrp/AsnC family transcriptional regulator [Candidatus Aenigmarchaeota archaeon]|nr:Lrp/AsnC family transcriptional regulator [Candidatus Aenigmarchaeota archaeon]